MNRPASSVGGRHYPALAELARALLSRASQRSSFARSAASISSMRAWSARSVSAGCPEYSGAWRRASIAACSASSASISAGSDSSSRASL